MSPDRTIDGKMFIPNISSQKLKILLQDETKPQDKMYDLISGYRIYLNHSELGLYV